jgi:hypothetical protein
MCVHICLSVLCYQVRWPNFPSKEFDCMFEAFSISERTVKMKMSEDLLYGKWKTSFTMFSDVKYQNVSTFFSETLKKLGNGVLHSHRRRQWSGMIRASWIRLAVNVTIPHIQSLRKLTGLLQDTTDLAHGTNTGHIMPMNLKQSVNTTIKSYLYYTTTSFHAILIKGHLTYQAFNSIPKKLL